MSITSIIPSIIFGIVLIIAWLPVIVLTEKNNKGNNDEYKLLLSKMSSDLILTDISDQVTFPNLESTSDPFTISTYEITSDFMNNNNNNIYVTVDETTQTTDANGKISTVTKIKSVDLALNIPSVGDVPLNNDDYIYLATQNNVLTYTKTDPINSNITYKYTFYSIPKDKKIMKVEGLQQFASELDMIIHNYEFGPEDIAKNAIKDRKIKSDKLQMWLGRIGTFLMLFGGLSLLISPLTFLNQLGDALPGPLKLLAIPGKIIASIYNTLSFFGSLILTLLMTFLVWSIINMPLVSILVGSLLVGLILYFNKK